MKVVLFLLSIVISTPGLGQDRYLGEYYNCTKNDCTTGEFLILKGDSSFLIRENSDKVTLKKTKERGSWNRIADTLSILSTDGEQNYLIKEKYGVVFLIIEDQNVAWPILERDLENALLKDEMFAVARQFTTSNESDRENLVKNIVRDNAGILFYEKEKLWRIFIKK